jgi:hypothetical protein
MNYSRFITCVLFALTFALLASCGGRQTSSTSGASINSAIAELDSMTTPKGADPAVFASLKDALRNALVGRGNGKLVATPPTGSANAIPDLVITDNGDGTYNYTWHYYNVGDYSQDGIVGVPDITPLAMHYNQTWNKSVPAEVNTLQAVADGSSNEKVDVADVTPIAMNFGVQVSAYRLEKCATENGTYTEVQIIPLSAGLDKETARMRFSIDITPEAGMWYRLVPVDGEGNGGEASNAMQPPLAVTTWGHSWGGANSEQGNSVAVDDAGSTFVAGVYGMGSGNIDSVLVKYSHDGELLWKKTWGGAETDNGFGVAVDDEGNSYVTGETDSFGVNTMVFILKYAPDGTLLWQKTWGGDRICSGYAITLDNTGLLYVTGAISVPATGKDGLLLLKYDSDGNYIDMKVLSVFKDTRGYAVTTNVAGDIYIAGMSRNNAQERDDVFVVKYSALGMLLEWQKQWGDDGTDDAYGISVDSSDNVYVAGRSNGSGVGQGGYDVVLFKLASNGGTLWKEAWGGGTHDEAFGMTIDSSANLYLTGGTYSFGTGEYEGFVLKFDSSGSRLWAKTWGKADQNDNFHAIDLFADGKLAITGWNPMANGVWGDASTGVTEALTSDFVDGAGTEVLPAGSDGVPAGIEGSPAGVADTGGGGDDIITLQVDPAGW